MEMTQAQRVQRIARTLLHISVAFSEQKSDGSSPVQFTRKRDGDNKLNVSIFAYKRPALKVLM